MSERRSGAPRGPRGRVPGTTLTEVQGRILEFIRRHQAERGFPPSMQDIGDALGVTSKSSVKHQLHQIEAKGYIRRDPWKPRSIRVVEPDEPEAERDEAPSNVIPFIRGGGLPPQVEYLTCECGEAWFETKVSVGVDGVVGAYGMPLRCVACGKDQPITPLNWSGA